MLQPRREEMFPPGPQTQRVYVYGIMRANQGSKEPAVPALKGLADNPVRIIVGDGLAALVSWVTTPQDNTPFEEELKDPEQAKNLILSHHRVLQRLLDSQTVLPMRFGALFTDDDKVTEALHEHRQGLLQALERVEGARKWGVKIFCDRAVLSRHLGEASPAVLAAQSELAAAAQGRAFFLQRRIERLAEEEAERAIAQGAEESRVRLCEGARADASMKLQPAAVHGRDDDMVWNDAFLVAKSDEGRFFALLDELRKSNRPLGFHYELNGPWPPFSFAGYRLGE
jgi:Gas vesicle synthesis protein GvpL/GvpF